MRGTTILTILCLTALCAATAAGADLTLGVVEWNIPGVPDSPAVVYRLDGRDIKARAGERVYISGPERGVAVSSAAVPRIATSGGRSGGMDTLAVAPPAAASPAQLGRTYPRTRVTIPGYAARGYAPRGTSENNGNSGSMRSASSSATSAAASPSASVAVESARAYAAIGGGGAGLPRAFTFDPDHSPVIINAVTSPGGRMPVRNANIYRRYSGGRAAAEVIETVKSDPRHDPDNSGMAPPGGGGLPRAEVVLPSSARGIGMGTEYGTGR